MGSTGGGSSPPTARQDFAAKISTGGASSESSSKPLFDAGMSGLEFFEKLLPLYNDWRGARLDLRKDIYGRYDQQREVEFARLRADIDRLGLAHAHLDNHTNNLRNHINSLFHMWSGPAAQAAHGYGEGFLQAAETVVGDLDNVRSVLATALPAVERACAQKAAAVDELYVDDIGGFAPEQIAIIIKIARHHAADSELYHIASHLGMKINTDQCGDLDGGLKDQAAKDATSWLETTFVSFFEGRKKAFDQICDTADQALRTAWDGLKNAMDHVNENPFGQLLQSITSVPRMPPTTYVVDFADPDGVKPAVGAGSLPPAGVALTTSAQAAGFIHPRGDPGWPSSWDTPTPADQANPWHSSDGHQHDGAGPGLGSTNAPQAGGEGGPELASMSDTGSDQVPQRGGHDAGQQGGGAMMGGIAMTGAMGQGGGGGNTDRGPSQWRTQGQLFQPDDRDARHRLRSVLGEDEPEPR